MLVLAVFLKWTVFIRRFSVYSKILMASLPFPVSWIVKMNLHDCICTDHSPAAGLVCRQQNCHHFQHMKKLLQSLSILLLLFGGLSYGQSIVCPGDSVFITLNGSVGSIQWEYSTDGTTWNTITGATSAALHALPSGETWYRAGVTDGTCPVVYSDTSHVDVSSLMADAGAGDTVCFGSMITLGGSPAATGGVAPYTYAWSPGTNLSSTTVANPNCTPAGPTTYTLTVTDAQGCVATSVVHVDTSGIGTPPGSQTFAYSGAPVNWVVPPCVSMITVECWGAQGGDANANGSDGGLGAYIKGDIAVTPGETLKVIVGQRGESGVGSLDGGGGGGGAFVIRVNGNLPLVIAAGGGGGCLYPTSSNGTGGSATSTPGLAGYANATIGMGGITDNGGGGGTGGGGGGWNGNGQSNNWSGGGGMQGGTGGTSSHAQGRGGYGGGGGSYHGGGGGGGFTGGSGGTYYVGGGGGGSYNTGSNQTNTAGVRLGHGQVIITW